MQNKMAGLQNKCRIKMRDYRKTVEELKKLTDEGAVQFVPPLRLDIETTGGKQKMYCWNTEGVFRLIQSIPSTKAEPFKRWLAKVGYERVQETEDPELARSVDIALTISPTMSVESFKQYFSSIIKHLADKFHPGWSHYVTLQTNRSVKEQKIYKAGYKMNTELGKVNFRSTVNKIFKENAEKLMSIVASLLPTVKKRMQYG